MTHICVNKLTTIGSDNGLSPGRRQAIIRTNAGILLICTLRNKLQWNFWSKIFIEENTLENIVCEIMSISSRHQCVNSTWSLVGHVAWRRLMGLIFWYPLFLPTHIKHVKLSSGTRRCKSTWMMLSVLEYTYYLYLGPDFKCPWINAVAGSVWFSVKMGAILCLQTTRASCSIWFAPTRGVYGRWRRTLSSHRSDWTSWRWSSRDP